MSYLARWLRWRLERPQLDPSASFPTRLALWREARPRRRSRG